MIDRIKKNAFARNSLILFIGTMVANFLGYVFHLVIGRMVSVEVFGEIESLLSLITIIAVPAATLTMVATRYAAGCKADNNKERNYDFFAFANKKIFFYTVPVFLVSLTLIPYAKRFLNITETFPLVIVWVILFVSSFSSIANGILTGWQEFRKVSWANIWGAVIKLLSVIIFIKLGFSLSGSVGSFLLGLLTTLFITVYFLRPLFLKRKIGKSIFEKNFCFSSLRSYVLPVFLGNISMTVLGNIDMVLAKHNLSPDLAGQYSALTIVSKIIYMVTIIVATVLFSMSAENDHKKSSSLSILKMASLVTAAICVGSIILYFLFPQFILGMFFGAKYSEAAHFLGWFSVFVALFSFAYLLFQYFLSMNKTGIAYTFLALAILEIPAILIVGKSISGMLTAIITIQFLAVASSLFYLFLINRRTS